MIRKTISMPDEMGRWIADQLASGRYGNESEYIRDLIRRDQENQRKLADLRTMLAVAEADHQRALVAGSDELARLIDTDHAQRVAADELRRGDTDRFLQRDRTLKISTRSAWTGSAKPRHSDISTG